MGKVCSKKLDRIFWTLKFQSVFAQKNRPTKLLFSFGLIASRTILQMNSVLIAFLSDLVSSRLMSVVSSANSEILAFCPFGSSIPRQICSWCTLRASIYTASTNRRGLNGNPWRTPRDTLKYQLVIIPAIITRFQHCYKEWIPIS